MRTVRDARCIGNITRGGARRSSSGHRTGRSGRGIDDDRRDRVGGWIHRQQ